MSLFFYPTVRCSKQQSLLQYDTVEYWTVSYCNKLFTVYLLLMFADANILSYCTGVVACNSYWIILYNCRNKRNLLELGALPESQWDSLANSIDVRFDFPVRRPQRGIPMFLRPGIGCGESVYNGLYNCKPVPRSRCLASSQAEVSSVHELGSPPISKQCWNLWNFGAAALVSLKKDLNFLK